MSKTTRFFGSAVFATALLFGAGALSPQAAQAASLTSDQISAIIGLLQSFGADQSVIANVQTALGGTSSGGGTQPWCHTFNSNLKVGDGDSSPTQEGEIGALQRVLNAEGFRTGDEHSTNFPPYFGEGTASAVVQFQAKYGIRQTGYVGPITRKKLNALYGCSNPVPPSTFSASPTSGGAPLTVMFYSNDVQGGTVNFGDGTSSAQLECDSVSAANSSVSSACPRTFTPHTYTAPGIYTATLQAFPQCAVYVGQTDFSNCSPVTIGKISKITITVTGGTVQPLTVVSPNGGEQWKRGTVQKIQWSVLSSVSSASMSSVNVYLRPWVACLYSGTVQCLLVEPMPYALATATQNDGVFEWAVSPNDLNGRIIPDGSYIVSVEDVRGTASDSSDKPFSIVSATAGSLSINPTSAGVKVGGTTEFQAMYQPPMPQCPIGFACPQVMPNLLPVLATWTSSNPKVATVAYPYSCPTDSNCSAQQLAAVVTGVSLGTATITATYKDSSGTMLTASAPVSTVMAASI
jgi:uncharacterized protein YjdB